MQQQLFDELIGTSPASTIDIDGIVKRQRRIGAARRLGGSMAAVLALAVAGGVALSSHAGPAGTAPATPLAQASSPAADVQFRLVYDTQETAAATAKRLSRELDQALRKEAPAATWIRNPDFPREFQGLDGQPLKVMYMERKDGTNYFSGGKGVLNEGRKGSLNLHIYPESWQIMGPGPDHYDWSCTLPGDATTDIRACTPGKAPNGAKLKIVTDHDKKSLLVWYYVAIELPDNRVLTLEVSNEFGGDGTIAQAGSPLTLEQVRAITIDVANTIKA
jgi:hypothetical protein